MQVLSFDYLYINEPVSGIHGGHDPSLVAILCKVVAGHSQWWKHKFREIPKAKWVVLLFLFLSPGPLLVLLQFQFCPQCHLQSYRLRPTGAAGSGV